MLKDKMALLSSDQDLENAVGTLFKFLIKLFIAILCVTGLSVTTVGLHRGDKNIFIAGFTFGLVVCIWESFVLIETIRKSLTKNDKCYSCKFLMISVQPKKIQHWF